MEDVRWSPGLMEAYNEGVPEDETMDWSGLKARDLRELSTIVQNDPSLVSQPRYIPSIAGVEWVRPSKVSERQARLEVEARIGRLEREIENLEDDIAQIQDQQAAQSNRQANRQTQPQPTGGGGLIRGGGGNQNTNNPRASRPDPAQQRIDAIREEIAERQGTLDGLYERWTSTPRRGSGSLPSRVARLLRLVSRRGSPVAAGPACSAAVVVGRGCWAVIRAVHRGVGRHGGRRRSAARRAWNRPVRCWNWPSTRCGCMISRPSPARRTAIGSATA